jgi:hypothetical protein
MGLFFKNPGPTRAPFGERSLGVLVLLTQVVEGAPRNDYRSSRATISTWAE